jgi:inosose dehydratase
VWFPDEPRQTPWQRFLDEVAQAGYEWIELGPYGYLPTDPGRLRDELDRRGLRLSGGAVAAGLHDEFDVELVFHPHADSHVDTQPRVERFLTDTDPALVRLCLDTGHIAYCGGDNLEIIRRHPERIGYVHLKQVDPAVMARVAEEGLAFPQAVALGAMVEPPHGVPDMPSLLAELERLDVDLFAIVEQDLFPCAPETPLPIATRTAGYLGGCGLGPVRAPRT